MPLKELVERRNLLHNKSTAQTILKHALNDPKLGNTAVVSSFGAESVVLLHMVSQIDATVPVIFLDTEMLFHETLEYQKEVADTLGLMNVRIVKPSRSELLAHDVDGLLHLSKPDACCDLRKVRPLEIALQEFDSWISGRKRMQNSQRTNLEMFEKSNDRIKVNPLAKWSNMQLKAYMASHRLPEHPLVRQGYPSVGCRVCTTKVHPGEDARAGRWRSQDKTECGIHLSVSHSNKGTA